MLSRFTDSRIRTRALCQNELLLDEEFEAIARKGSMLPVLKGWT
jgi:hypothetical protein